MYQPKWESTHVSLQSCPLKQKRGNCWKNVDDSQVSLELTVIALIYDHEV